MSDPIDSAINAEHSRQERAWNEAMTEHPTDALLRQAAERGLEWVIDAANEINDKTNSVFQNAMKDVRFIEAALEAAKPSTPAVPQLERFDFVGPREFVLLASYCGNDNDTCTEARPCADCLAMCNVFCEGGQYLRQLGSGATGAAIDDEGLREQIISEIVRGSFDHRKVGWADEIADRIIEAIRHVS